MFDVRCRIISVHVYMQPRVWRQTRSILNSGYYEPQMTWAEVDSLKSTIGRPSLKQRNLDPEDMNSFRPILNLTFLSKQSNEPLRSDSLSTLSCTSYAISSPPICLSFVPFHRDSCFGCPRRFSTNDGQSKHKCSGASGSQCRSTLWPNQSCYRCCEIDFVLKSEP